MPLSPRGADVSPRLPLSSCPLQEGEQMTPQHEEEGPFHLRASAWEMALLIVYVHRGTAISSLH